MAAVAVALALGAAARGDDGSDEAVVATLGAAQAAMGEAMAANERAARSGRVGVELAEEPLDRLCRLLSHDAEVVVGHAKHGSFPLDCVADVYPFVDSLREYGNGRRPRLLDFERLTPDTAAAAYRLPTGDTITVPLSRERGAWRLDGIFDASLSAVQANLTSGDPRLPSKRELAVARPPLDLDRPVSVAKLGGPVRMTIHTVFGFMSFGRCRLDGRLRVDATGRGWLHGVRFKGGSPCNDVRACLDLEDRVAPWRARLSPPAAGGRPALTLSACVDSCFGRFEGAWPLRPERAAPGWRARSDAMVGTSGLRLDGALRLGSATRAR